MYMAVKKPALPASVYTRPTCCKLAAINRAHPQRIPAFHSLGSAHFAVKTLKVPLSKTKDKGTRKATANPHRIAWKVKGPMWSMPTLWAMKALPQMSVAARREILPRNFCFIFITGGNDIIKKQ